MSAKTTEISKEAFESLKKNRDALVTKRNALNDEIKSLRSELNRAIEMCPKKERGSVADMSERITRMEEELEYSSFSQKEERERNREIADLKKTLEKLSAYATAQDKINSLRASINEKNDQAKELTQEVNAAYDSVNSMEALLRIKELTGRSLSADQLKHQDIALESKVMGRVIGKGGANIHNLEQRFSVFLGTRDDLVTVYGEEGNVRRCIAELDDMRNEVEQPMKLPTEQIHALMAHENAYRRQIETQSGAFIRLSDKEGIVLVGGKNAVQQCERAINDLFKKTTRFEVTPFLRSLLLRDQMKLLHQLEKDLPAYLSLVDKFTAILILGTPMHQKQALARLQEFAATHQEHVRTVEYSDVFQRYLFTQRTVLRGICEKAHVGISRAKEGGLTISGIQEDVDTAQTLLATSESDMEQSSVKLPLSGMQVDLLLAKQASALASLRDKTGSFIDVDKSMKLLIAVPGEGKKESVREELGRFIGTLHEASVSIDPRVMAQFVGAKGSHITAVRDEFGVQIDASDSRILIGGEQDSVERAKQSVEAWLEAHSVCSLQTEPELAFGCIVGKNGNSRKALEKQLAVEIRVDNRGEVTVLGQRDRCESAIQQLRGKIESYSKEHAVVQIPAVILNNAPELRSGELKAKAAELGVSLTPQFFRGLVVVEGPEAGVSVGVSYLKGLAERYAEYGETPIPVVKEQIGVLLGKGGENARQLEGKLGVSIRSNKEGKVWLWGPQSSLQAASQAICDDLMDRVQLTKNLDCTARQVESLILDRMRAVREIERETKAVIRVPKTLPAIGPTAISVRGNQKQLDQAMPLLREALQGMRRRNIEIPAGLVEKLQTKPGFQMQRLALEGHCRITQSPAGLMVVGPKEGVSLVHVRVWEQLAQLAGEYFVLPCEEGVSLALQEDETPLKSVGCSVSVEGCKLLVHCDGDITAVKSALEGVLSGIGKEHRVVYVGKELVPFLIGSKGVRVQQMRKLSGAQLQTVHEDSFHVFGTEEAVAKCVELVENAVQEYHDTHRSVEMGAEMESVLKANRMAVLREVQRECLVNISLGKGEMAISGLKKQSVDDAISKIQQMVEQAKMNPEMTLEKPRSPVRREKVVKAKEEDEAETIRNVLEKMKSAPSLPKKEQNDVSRILGLNESTVGGSDCYKSESGYTVEF